MANRTISENINQAISDFKGIKQAIIDKGVEIPQGTPTSEYGAKIGEFKVSKGTLDVSGITNFNNFLSRNRVPAEYLDELNTRSGTDFSSMFYECSNLTISPKLDTSNGTDFSNMFNRCTNLTTVQHIDTSNGTNFRYMFSNCTNLTTVPQIDTSNGTNFERMFENCTNLNTVPKIKTGIGANFSSIFKGCDKLTTIPQIDTSNVTNFYGMFYECSNLTTIPQIDTSNGTNFSSMFYDCEELTSVELDTSKGTIFGYMFYRCYDLSTVKLVSFVAQANMFESCSKLTNLTVTGTITVNATNALKLNYSKKLTVESLLNVLNALKDNTGGTTYNIQLGSTNLAKLTDEQKAIATNKNYTLS